MGAACTTVSRVADPAESSSGAHPRPARVPELLPGVASMPPPPPENSPPRREPSSDSSPSQGKLHGRRFRLVASRETGLGSDETATTGHTHTDDLSLSHHTPSQLGRMGSSNVAAAIAARHHLPQLATRLDTPSGSPTRIWGAGPLTHSDAASYELSARDGRDGTQQQPLEATRVFAPEARRPQVPSISSLPRLDLRHALPPAHFAGIPLAESVADDDTVSCPSGALGATAGQWSMLDATATQVRRSFDTVSGSNTSTDGDDDADRCEKEAAIAAPQASPMHSRTQHHGTALVRSSNTAGMLVPRLAVSSVSTGSDSKNGSSALVAVSPPNSVTPGGPTIGGTEVAPTALIPTRTVSVAEDVKATNPWISPGATGIANDDDESENLASGAQSPLLVFYRNQPQHALNDVLGLSGRSVEAGSATDFASNGTPPLVTLIPAADGCDTSASPRELAVGTQVPTGQALGSVPSTCRLRRSHSLCTSSPRHGAGGATNERSHTHNHHHSLGSPSASPRSSRSFVGHSVFGPASGQDAAGQAPFSGHSSRASSPGVGDGRRRLSVHGSLRSRAAVAWGATGSAACDESPPSLAVPVLTTTACAGAGGGGGGSRRWSLGSCATSHGSPVASFHAASPAYSSRSASPRRAASGSVSIQGDDAVDHQDDREGNGLASPAVDGVGGAAGGAWPVHRRRMRRAVSDGEGLCHDASLDAPDAALPAAKDPVADLGGTVVAST